MQALSTFRLIERISNLLRSEERKKLATFGLQSVHIQVLEYLATCNRFSDTPAAVAEYLGLTKGTISQSLQVLARKGYLTKTPDIDDGRVVHLALSELGKHLLDSAKPVDVFMLAQTALDKHQYSTIDEALSAILAELQKANQTKSFGVCHSCVNFINHDNAYLCKLTQQPLSIDDSKKICREHVLKPLSDIASDPVLD